MGRPKTRIEVSSYQCVSCEEVFVRNNYSTRVTCSDECYKDKFCRGENNRSYGRRWTKEERETQSKLVTEKMQDPDVLYKVGSANRGTKFSSDRIFSMHGHRNSD